MYSYSNMMDNISFWDKGLGKYSSINRVFLEATLKGTVQFINIPEVFLEKKISSQKGYPYSNLIDLLKELGVKESKIAYLLSFLKFKDSEGRDSTFFPELYVDLFDSSVLFRKLASSPSQINLKMYEEALKPPFTYEDLDKNSYLYFIKKGFWEEEVEKFEKEKKNRKGFLVNFSAPCVANKKMTVDLRIGTEYFPKISDSLPIKFGFEFLKGSKLLISLESISYKEDKAYFREYSQLDSLEWNFRGSHYDPD